MAINFKKIWTGLGIVPKTASTSDQKGELEVISGTGKLNYHNGTSNSPVVTEAHTATLTNKTLTSPVIDTGVSGTAIDTDGTLAANSDTLLASQKAVKTYVDTSSGAVQGDVDDLITLSGVPANSTDLGTFTGTTIPDGSDNKEAFQALETGLEAHISDATDAHAGSAITNTPAGTIAATTVQAAINELDGDIQAHITDTVDAHDASAISVVPTGNLAATEVQAALVEHQGDIDTINTTSLPAKVTGPGSATDEAVVRFDGTTGKLVQNSVVTITDAGIAAGLTGLTSSGTVSSTGTLAVAGSLTEAITTDSSATGANATVTNPATSILRLTNASLTSVDMISSPVTGEVLTIINATGVDITINNDLGGTAANRILTGTKANLTLKDEASIIVKYDSSESRWMVIGGTGAGSGSGINYILSSDGGSTTGWATYADAAAAIPVDGTGGSPNVTFATTTSSPLIGTSSFLFTKDAANRQGQGVSYAFTIDSGYQAQILRISFPYSASANYVDTVSGNLINSDMQVFVYDITNATLIPVVEQNISATLQGQYVGSFQASSNSTSYRLILHVASTNASSYTLKLDNVVVGPQTLIKGSISTDWVSFTPTGGWTGAVTYTGKYRRVGDCAEIRYQLVASGTPTGTNLDLNLPTGLSIDTAKLPSGTSVWNINGQGIFRDASVGNYPLLARYLSTTSVRCRYLDDAAAGVIEAGNLQTTQPATVVSTDEVEMTIIVPIQGWSSNLQLSEDAGNRQIIVVANTQADQSVTANVTNFQATSIKDTTASWSGTVFTAPESGTYYGSLAYSNGTDLGGHTESIYVNGSLTRRILTGGTGTGDDLKHGFFMIDLVKGDQMSFRTNLTTTTLANVWINIAKMTTPQTLAGAESVIASYTTNAGQTVTDGNTIVFEDLVFDSHNAMNTSTGVYTVPVSGKYLISTQTTTNGVAATVGNIYNNRLRINGSNVATSNDDTCENTASRKYITSITATRNLNKGDTISIDFLESLPAVTLTATGQDNRISIVRVGN